MSETSLLEEYLDLTAQYRTKYGTKTVVLLQVGVFYEVYGLLDVESMVYSETATPLVDFVRVCGLNIMDKKLAGDKRIMHKEFAVVGAGFRDYSLDKYIQRLIEANYTAVTFVQEKVGKVTKRVFDGVYSSGTYLPNDDEQHHTTNNVCCIWIEMMFHRGSRSNKMPSASCADLVVGLAVANIFTGTSSVCEWVQAYGVDPTACDKLERMVTVHIPSEYVIVSNLAPEALDAVLQYSGIKREMCHLVDLATSTAAQHCSQQKYTRHCLGTMYGSRSVDILQECSLFPTATQAFCFLLDFIKEHNPNLVKNIATPNFQLSERVLLANHTLRQLNVLDVAALLNQCCTAMGKRRFHDELVHPTTDVVWLEGQYHWTEVAMATVERGRLRLRDMRDLEKMGRQLVLRKLTVSSLRQLYATLEKVLLLEDIGYALAPDVQGLLDYMARTFDFEADVVFLRPGVSRELDACVAGYAENQRRFHEFHHSLNEMMRSSPQDTTEYVRIHETEKSGFSLQITKRRAQVLKGKLPSVTLRSASLGNYDEVVCPDNVCAALLTQKETLQTLLQSSLSAVQGDMERDFYAVVTNAAAYVGRMDVLYCKAHLARKFNYCRPRIDDEAGKAFVQAGQLRHALIERLHEDETYVANDVSIGQGHPDGILLYGTNAVGKTSLIRALGIAVIMAQAGLYVPCASFVYRPFTAVFSRILGNDNLFKGLSTFAVEMSELRVILKMADENSLILGDELCSGTETESALSIFVAGLTTLSTKRCTFLFATHFHEIVKYEEIRQLDTLRLKHMSVHYDRETDTLKYDRLLKDGSGDCMYGLEVCKSLHLPHEFLELAYSLRTKYFPGTRGCLQLPTSVYNSHKIRGLCEICGDVSTETHHVVPQKMADAQGYVTTARGTFHKNHAANLLSLCESCHQNQHRRKIFCAESNVGENVSPQNEKKNPDH